MYLLHRLGLYMAGPSGDHVGVCEERQQGALYREHRSQDPEATRCRQA